MQFIMSLTRRNGMMPFLSGGMLSLLQVDWVQVSAITPLNQLLEKAKEVWQSGSRF